MAITSYEILDTTSDVTTTRTLLHESIPLTGTLISGTYGVFPSEENIKNYTHGQFQSVYDYPYLSSSANHILDLTVGYDESSTMSKSFGAAPTGSGMQAKKINMYNEFSQVLLGYTGSTNTVRMFELDLSLDESGHVMKEAFVVNFSRLITKDQVKKGSFSITLGYGPWLTPFSVKRVLTDSASSDNGGTANTFGGDYGVLFDTGSIPRGIVFYEAGIALLGTGSFKSDGGVSPQFYAHPKYGNLTVAQALQTASISASCDAFRHRIENISFNNTTEINSTIYFCRVPHNKYNHSANPTYLSSSTIRVKSVNTDSPIAYITTIGLYSSNNELLAVAKLSEPLRKDPTNEMTLRVRLDY